MKESDHSAVYVVKSQKNGNRYVLLQFHGTAEIYRRLMTITSPHLPKIYEVEEQDGIVTVLEEYIQGDTLAFLLEGIGLDRSETKDLMLQFCDALELLHKNGIVHRDIKAENVIVRGKTAVLIDFNASRVYKSAQTEDTVVLGTTGFAAPEQYGISQSDNRVDVYALGVLLNIMLTGQHPSAKLADGPGGKIVRRCTMVSPNQRFQSVEQMKKRLKLMAAGARSGLRGGCVVLAAVLLACAVGIGVHTALRPAGAEKPEASTPQAAIAQSTGSAHESAPDSAATLEQEASALDASEAPSLLESESVPAELPDAGSEQDNMNLIGFYSKFPETGEQRISDSKFLVTEEQRTVWFLYPKKHDGSTLTDVQCYTGQPEMPVAPTDQVVLDHCTFGEQQNSGIAGFFCMPINIGSGFSGSGNLHMQAYYGENNNIGANISIVSAGEATADGEAVQQTALDYLGFYTELPQESGVKAQVFHVTDEGGTLWFSYPKIWYGAEVQSVDIYLGGDPDGPAPTDQSVLDHCTLGDPIQSDIPGVLCVPVSIDSGFTGQGNLHLEASYGISKAGGNILLRKSN